MGKKTPINEIIYDLEKIKEKSTELDALDEEINFILGDQKLHALINNAALQITGNAHELRPDDLARSFAVNVMACFALSKLCYPNLRANLGCIINVSSVHSKLSKPGFLAYSTSKAALSAMTRNLAIEWGGKVRVNGIEPGAVETEMLLDGFDGDETVMERLKEIQPSCQISKPSEIAEIIMTLIENPNMNFTGNLLSIDGGISSVLKDL